MRRVAAIDCGTNSVRLLVADLPSAGVGELVEVTRRMEIVRLGQGVDRTGRLATEAIERTRVALADYAAVIAALGATRVRMVATSATRDAANADVFAAMARGTLGVEPEVVSGQAEARLSFTGAVRGLPPGRYLVVDIGGGSTEFIAGSVSGPPAPTGSSAEPPNAPNESPAELSALTNSSAEPPARPPTPADGKSVASVDRLVSVDIGCVRMTERHLPGDPPTVGQVADATTDIEAVVAGALRVVGGLDGARLVGVAGTVTTMAALALRLPAYQSERIHHASVSRGEVNRITAELLGMTHVQRSVSPVMHPGRVDVIGGGALILRTVMALSGASEVIASEHDILDGIAWSLV